MVKAVLELLRVRQWVKNSFVLAPLFFGSEIFKAFAVTRASTAFIVFCLVSSAVYIFNDWRDIEADRQHSKKASRPLPSGRVPVPLALAAGKPGEGSDISMTSSASKPGAKSVMAMSSVA